MNRISTLLVGVSLCIFGASAVGAELAKDGKYDQNECFNGPHHLIVHSKDQMGGSYTVSGVSPVAGGLFQNTSSVCNGAWTLVNGEYNEIGSCEYTDASGDKFFGVFGRKNKESGTWRVVGGTGKYNGMVNTSNWMPVTDAPQPAGQIAVCTHEWGSWKMR